MALCLNGKSVMRQSSNNETTSAPDAVAAVIGAGSIGTAFALVFAAGCREVRIYESNEGQRRTVKKRIAESLHDLHAFGLTDEEPDALLTRIRVSIDLGEALSGASHVQECVPEDLDLKRALFAELDALAADDAVLASSSSAITASEIAVGLAGAARCLVAHPGNPPFLIRVIEIVPAPFTAPAAVERTCDLMRSVGLAPITVRKEIRGFVFNRLQGALLREAYCLVRDGVASVEDIDLLVRDGLGLRWAVVGPFETADLNRRGGIGAHAKIMGEAYRAMGAERGQDDPWTPALIDKVEAERRALLPLARWEERVGWRDRQLMRLLVARGAARER